MKNRGSFQKDLQITSKALSRIKLTPLSTFNSEYTYHVDWTNIHRNHHGSSGRTTRITWYLPCNWAGIIPQRVGEYRVSFNISTPIGYWQTKEFLFRIHVPAEEVLPYNELMKTQVNLFFEYDYVVRAYNSNWSTYAGCPKKRLPWEALSGFLSKYPYSSFSRSLKAQLKRTKRIVRDPDSKYDETDMAELDKILGKVAE